MSEESKMQMRGPPAPERDAQDKRAAAAAGPIASSRTGGDIEQAIGTRLKAMFDDVVNEPVPDRFLELLARLENPEPPAGDATGEAQ